MLRGGGNGACHYLLDLRRIGAGIQSNQKAIRWLENIGETFQERGCFVPVEVTYLGWSILKKKNLIRCPYLLESVPMLDPRDKTHLRLDEICGVFSHSRPSSYVPKSP